MKYLAQLKFEKRLPDELPKLPKAEKEGTCNTAKTATSPFDSFDSSKGRHFSENETQDSAAQKTTLPAPVICHDCLSLEVQHIGGKDIAGCVKKITDTSPWVETWRRIPADLPHCPAPNKKRMAQGYGCGKCGANRYQETPDGWKCEVCGKIYALIGGSRGPVTIH